MAANGPTQAEVEAVAVARRQMCALLNRGAADGAEAATRKQRQRNWQFGT
jgi:hypothetical protein